MPASRKSDEVIFLVVLEVSVNGESVENELVLCSKTMTHGFLWRSNLIVSMPNATERRVVFVPQMERGQNPVLSPLEKKLRNALLLSRQD